jgi:hypothetical protein
VAARSKAWVCGRLLAGIAGSNRAGDMDVCLSCECCVLSVSVLCVGLITSPEESYRMWWDGCLSMVSKRRLWGLGPLGLSGRERPDADYPQCVPSINLLKPSGNFTYRQV